MANITATSLRAGRHELLEPLLLTGDRAEFTGELVNGRPATTLRRGRRPDGSLYSGPLVLIQEAHNTRLRNIIIEGARFTRVMDKLYDERHPLTTDRTSPMFPCAKLLNEPDCYDRHNFGSDLDSDIFVRDATNIEIEGVSLLDPVRIGIGIGARSRGVVLRRCSVRAAGDYGIWIGCGFDPVDGRLPLSADHIAMSPRAVQITDVLVERCGAAGVYVEGSAIHLDRSRLIANCCDAPGNDEGGQLTIDYKADDIRLTDCVIVGAPEIVRRLPGGGEALFGAFGVEACGSNISLENTTIEGNSREAVQIVGGRGVRFLGGTRMLNNHLAQVRHPRFPASPGRQSISVTALAHSVAVNAVTNDITLDGVYCENGLMVWSDGSAADWVLDTLTVRCSDLSGPDSRGVVEGGVGDRSLRGAHWDICERSYDG